MDIVKYILFIILGFIIYLNILASVSIIKSTDLTKLQKISQSLLAWFIPVVGAKIVLHILSESEPDAVKWIPQRGHGWLIVGGTHYDALQGRRNEDYYESDAGTSEAGDAGGGD